MTKRDEAAPAQGAGTYSVSVRPAHGGEASGTYYRRANGDLQILGYSLEMPEDLSDLSESAWQKYCA